jgi:hypothetical protein
LLEEEVFILSEATAPIPRVKAKEEEVFKRMLIRSIKDFMDFRDGKKLING